MKEEVAAQWCCEERDLTGWTYHPKRCTLVAKVGILATKRNLCAYHALVRAKLGINRRFWGPGELLTTFPMLRTEP